MLLQPRMGAVDHADVRVHRAVRRRAPGRRSGRPGCCSATAVSFGVKDPQFGIDIGCYVFGYPFWRYLLGVGFTTMFLSLLGALAVHYLFGGVRLQGEGDRITTAARAHLSTLVARVRRSEGRRLLPGPARHGARAQRAASTSTAPATPPSTRCCRPRRSSPGSRSSWRVAILVFSNAFVRNLAWPAMALGLLVLSAIALGGIYPFVVQTFQVKPNTGDKEAAVHPAQHRRDPRRVRADTAITTTTYSANNQTPPDHARHRHHHGAEHPAARPGRGRRHVHAAPAVRGFYDFGEKLDIDRYTTDRQAPGLRRRRPRDRLQQLDRAAAGTGRTRTRSTRTGTASSPRRPTRRSATASRTSSPASSAPQQTSQSQACQSPTDQFPVSAVAASTTARAWAPTRSSARPKGADPVEYDGPTGELDRRVRDVHRQGRRIRSART